MELKTQTHISIYNFIKCFINVTYYTYLFFTTSCLILHLINNILFFYWYSSVNKITGLSDFENCHKLQELYLRKNNIKDINDLVYLQVRNLIFILILGTIKHLLYKLLSVKCIRIHVCLYVTKNIIYLFNSAIVLLLKNIFNIGLCFTYPLSF